MTIVAWFCIFLGFQFDKTGKGGKNKASTKNRNSGLGKMEGPYPRGIPVVLVGQVVGEHLKSVSVKIGLLRI